MLNSNNISLLLIILITVLLIHIHHKKNHLHNQGNENFTSGSKFRENISLIEDGINKEISNSKSINNLLRGINEKNNKDKCFIVERDVDNVIKDITYKDIDDINQCPIEGGGGIIINPTTDLKKLRELNDEIKNTKININPILQNIDTQIKQKRLAEINDNLDDLMNETNYKDIKNIKQISNNLTGKSLNVEKVHPNDKNDNQYYIYLNSVNNQNGIEYRCLSYNRNNPENPYETKKCNKFDDKQKFNLDKIILNKKCYNYPDTKTPNNKSLEECHGANVIKLENKTEFIKKINSRISEDNKFFRLSENNIFTVPKQFSFISPVNSNKCLTIDQEGISFQDCINNPSQQWNYSNQNISC